MKKADCNTNRLHDLVNRVDEECKGRPDDIPDGNV